MKNTLALVLMVFGSFGAFAADKFFLECTNTLAEEEDIQKVYFFNKIKRFTGYYPTYKDGFKVNFDNIPIEMDTNSNKCKFKSDKNNEYYFACKSEWVWGDESEHTIGINKTSLNLYRVMTTSSYGYQYITSMKCKKGDVKEAEIQKKKFEQKIKSIKKNIKKGNPENQI